MLHARDGRQRAPAGIDTENDYVAFVARHPDVMFSVLADHAKPIDELGEALSASRSSRPLRVLLDLLTVKYMLTWFASPMKLFGMMGFGAWGIAFAAAAA